MSKRFSRTHYFASNTSENHPSQDYYRAPHPSDAEKRRVSFKKTSHNNRIGKKFNKDWGNSLRAHLEDEDVDMGQEAGASSNNPHKWRRNTKFNGKPNKRFGSPAPTGRRKLIEGPGGGWYKVTLAHGRKYEKSVLLNILLDKVRPLPFWPMAWEINGSHVTFFLDDFKVAEKLHSLDRQIQLPNGFKLSIRVHGSIIPNIDMTPETKETVRAVMAKRYNSATKALDLTKFHADPDLRDCICALAKPIVFTTIIDIIAENIPELEALNLFDNKITGIIFLRKTIRKLAQLKILHMGNNRLRDISHLDALSGLPIVELLLDGNPLCDKFKDQNSYVSEVRKRLPKVIKLDGVDLPPPISFDITEEVKLPSPTQTFLCHSEGGAIVRQFLEQYFLIYDSENRQPLLHAYHESAMFSLTTAYPYGYGKERNVPWLNWYHTDNRNLLKVHNSDIRQKLLKQGQLAVVSFLQDMPLTKHDMHSFTVDLTIFTPVLLSLTVSGMFKELKSGHKIPPLRFFFRTLIITPAGSGFCIVNEELHVSNATPEQATNAFKVPDPVISAPTPTPSVTPVSSPIVQPIAVEPADSIKEQMVKQMAEQSGMNVEWSLKCLQDSQWDFQRASTVFNQLKMQGIVPPEAFVQ